MVSINELAGAIKLSGKEISINNLDGQSVGYGFPCPLGVMGRNSHNKLFKEKVGWESKATLFEGMAKTYDWIKNQVKNAKN